MANNWATSAYIAGGGYSNVKKASDNPYLANPTTNPYPSGNAGVQADLDLRNKFADFSGSLVGKYAGMANKDQLNAARKALGNAGAMSPTDLSAAYSAWDSVPLTQGQIDNSIAAGYNSVYNAGMQLGKNLNQQVASMGLRGNPYAPAALGQSAQFAAAGQRGQLRADLDAINAGLKAQRASGYSNLKGIESAEAQQQAALQAQLAERAAALELTPYAPDTSQRNADLQALYDEYLRYLNGPRQPDNWTQSTATGAGVPNFDYVNF